MKIGLLPLYIALYDKTSPGVRPRMEAFYADVADAFRARGVSVETSDFCRIKPEFEKTIAAFEKAEVDAIVTLHIAYSPSLESIEALTKTDLPIVVLDATDTMEFTPMSPNNIMYCHGIHGVMDMCSMLIRYGKPFAIAAGHFPDSDCVDRATGFVRAAVAARALKTAKVALVGGAFDGMGDFTVSPAELKKTFGITVNDAEPEVLSQISASITNEEIEEEKTRLAARFTMSESTEEEAFFASLRAGLAVRKYVEKAGLTAFSVNFLQVGEGAGIPAMPFIECCLAMERGTGYAGEGDGLTAAFTGAFLKAWPESSFVEIFCPDWKNNTVLLSHMGEVNYRIINNKPTLRNTGGNLTGGAQPYAGYARMKGGSGVYVNVSRAAEGYKLLIAPCEMLDVTEDAFPGTMRGWMQPESLSTAAFLEALSVNGATHHSTFIYDATAEQLEYFGRLLSMETVVVK
ncbi:MAG: hypothetical protein E7408_00760 [Ruminococcaceae bacterium]|nr:hypothetical protein [Oscillospiraceae bacterium]